MTEGSDTALTRVGVLGGFVTVAFLIRLSLFQLEPLISPDSLSYTESGINLVSGRGLVNDNGDFRGKLQPLFPIFVGLANLIVPDRTFSGAFVSMIMGSLLIWPVFRFCATAYETKTAYTASAIIVAYPYLANYASKALTEATYTFFLFLTAWWGWLAFRRGRTSDYALCGVFVGLAYLTRFEIAGYLLLYLLFVLAASRGRRWKQLAMMTGIFVLLITPYHVYNWLYTGSPMFLGHIENGMRYMVRVLKFGDVDSPWSSFFGNPARYAQHYIKGVNVAYTEYLPTLFPPVLIAITGAGLVQLLRRRDFGFTETYLGAIIAVTLFGYPLLRPSGRNLTVALPFLIILLAKGITEISPLIAAHLPAIKQKAVSATAVAWITTFIVSVSVLPQTYRPLLLGQDPVAPFEFMEMGKWIKANLPEAEMVGTRDRRISFYAEIRGVDLGESYRYEDVIAAARRHGVRYLALSAYGPSEIEWHMLQERIRERRELKLVHSISRRPKMTVQLYEFVGQPTEVTATK
jgi:4-amino-4-deoxy-L-arabinose transferase-like glycosyltransferase